MDYDENMNAMVNAAGAEAIKPAEIDAREAYARGRREAIEEAAGLARLMFPHGAAAFVAELTKGPRRGQ